MLISSRPVHPRGALMRRRDVGRGRRLRPEGNVTSGLGRPRADSGAPAYLGPPPSDPPAPHYDGAAEEAGSGSGEGRTRPTGEGRKLDPGLGPAPETRPPTRAEA